MVEGKLTPTVENDPFSLALGKPLHPGRVIGAGGHLQGWQKVMGESYTKSGRRHSSVSSQVDMDAKVESIKEDLRKEMQQQFNAILMHMNMPPLSSNMETNSTSHPQYEHPQKEKSQEENQHDEENPHVENPKVV